MMGVEVAKEEGVGGVELLKDGVKVEDVAGWAGGDWRNVDIDKVKEGSVEVCVDGDDFE